MRFIEAARNSRRELLYLIYGEAGGHSAWYYLLVEKNKLALLKEILKKSGDLHVSHYGEVLASGWGDTPPQDVTEAIMRRFQS